VVQPDHNPRERAGAVEQLGRRGFSQALLDEITNAYGNGMLFTAAAGNYGSNNDATKSYPASYNAPNIVAVAATDSDDNLASWSNYGATTVDLAAPGVGIWSTVPNGYASYNGTSMATPHVSGVAALVLAACGDLAVNDLKNTILGNVDSVGALAGKVATGGRLNAFDAVDNCGGAWQPPQPTPDFSVAVSPTSRSIKRGRSTTYTVTVIPVNDFKGDVSLNASVSVDGTTQSFSKSTVQITSTSSGSSVLTIGTTSGTARTTYTITVEGTGTVGSHSATVTLRVR
jgi:serine protease